MRRVVAGDRPVSDVAAEAAAALRAGGLVLLPTDTVYGLAVAAARPDATARLFAAKGRPPDTPLAVLVADGDQAADVAELDDRARQLIARHWPGALTLVLPRRPGMELSLGARPETVGVRCPDRELLRRVAAEVGPIATTSANRHGQPTPRDVDGVLEQLAAPIDLVVDGGPCTGEPSTVVDLTEPQPLVRRNGPVVVDLTGYDRPRRREDGEH